MTWSVQDLKIVDKKILKYLREGKTTMDISVLLNKEGHRTFRGDIYLRKTVNNRITLMKEKGIEIPPLPDARKGSSPYSNFKSEPIIPTVITPEPIVIQNTEPEEYKGKSMRKKQQTVKLVKPHIYETEGGKYRVRIYVKGTLYCKTYVTLQEADLYLESITGTKDTSLPTQATVIAPEANPVAVRLGRPIKQPKLTQLDSNTPLFPEENENKDNGFAIIIGKNSEQLVEILSHLKLGR